jgi:nucleotide-binding universal stress UspA family protein
MAEEVMLMGNSDPHTGQYLTLDNLVVNPKLVQRLPPALARRYHALPVAEHNDCITVAMADPDDAMAREAVMTALGTTMYVVQSDLAAIDASLAEMWPDETHCSLHLLVCAQASFITDETEAYEAYAQAIGDLLGAQISHFHTPVATGVALDALVKKVGHDGYDLVVLGELDQSPVECLLSGRVARKATEWVPTLLLVVRWPQWPLRRMLLVIRGDEMDDVTVDWVVRLARPGAAAVTALTIVPPMPAMYHGMVHMEQGLAALLAGNSPLSRQMHRTAQRLVDEGIKSTFRLRQGVPEWQISCEVAEGDYDLVAVAAERHPQWLRWLLGELVGPLLHRTDRPVLIARPTTA